MPGFWRTHHLLQDRLVPNLLVLLPEQEQLIRFHAYILEKAYALNLDRLLPQVINQYPTTGRPPINQPDMFRALVVMSPCKEGVTSFGEKLEAHRRVRGFPHL